MASKQFGIAGDGAVDPVINSYIQTSIWKNSLLFSQAVFQSNQHFCFSPKQFLVETSLMLCY